MEYNSQSQKNLISRRQSRRKRQVAKIKKLLNNPTAYGDFDFLYSSEAKWLEKHYPVFIVFPNGKLDTKTASCIIFKAGKEKTS